MKYSTDIVVIDLEATCPPEDVGDNRVERSNIIEIGAVRLDRRSLAVVDEFSELVRPHEYPVHPFITGLTAITPEMVADKDGFAAVGARFLKWYGPRNRAMLAAFGVYYDVPLLRRECDACGLDYAAHIAGGAYDLRAIGTAWLAQNHERTSGQRLETMLEKMGVDLTRLTLHRAVDDARAAAAVLQVFHLGYAL
jgi:DNA polymerase III epsilon subunit-like protein